MLVLMNDSEIHRDNKHTLPKVTLQMDMVCWDTVVFGAEVRELSKHEVN